MKKTDRIRQVLNMWRLIPAWIVIKRNKNEALIIDEIEYWDKCYGGGDSSTLFDKYSVLILRRKEYRSLLCYRVGGGKTTVYMQMIKVLFPPLDSLYIGAEEIGPRLFIQHGFSTIIAAKRLGANCWINQQVTIGFSFSDQPPVIGNGVRISAGAKVIGDIYVGDNAIIGANAVVVKNVEEKSVVGGVPAKVIGKNKDHLLYNIDSRTVKRYI